MPTNDPLGPVWPGDRPPSSARAFDAYRRAAIAERRRAIGEAPDPGPLDFPADPASVVLVRAVSDALDAWQVSTYGTPPITPVALASRKEVGRRPKFDAGTPTAADNDVCITIEPAARGEAARAVASGVAVCRLLVNDESHTRAVPIAGDKTQLETSDVGGYAILWKPDEDDANGERWGLVLLSGGNAGGNDPNACRSMLVGKGPDSALTGEIPAGVGKCANVGPETVYLAYDADVTPPNIGYWGGWVSTPFTTRAGATTATVFLNEEGEPAAVLTADAGSGTIVTRPMTYVGCDGRGRMRFKTFDCLWCGDYWAGPCGDNEFELLVSCGVRACGDTTAFPPRINYRVRSVTGTGTALANFTGTLVLGETGATTLGGSWNGTEHFDEADHGDGPFWGELRNPGKDPWDTGAEQGVYAVLVEGPRTNPTGCMTLQFWISARSMGGVEAEGDPAVLVGEIVIAFTGTGLDMTWNDTSNPAGDHVVEFEMTDATIAEETDLCGDQRVPSACCDGEGESVASRPPLSMVVPTGDMAGTYALTWDAADGRWESAEFDGVRFGDPFTAGQWRLTCAGGIWRLDFTAGGSSVGTYPQLSVSCSPFALVMAGNIAGSEDITIGIAA